MFWIIAAGMAPGLALLSYFYLRDELEPEPITLVSKMFASGALLVFPLMFIQYVLEKERIIVGGWLDAFVSASLLEEFFKWFVLFFLVFDHIEFDEHYDGIVYGTAVALGFASLENILYLVSYGPNSSFVISRALLPVSSHALFGVVMGYYVGKAKFTTSLPLRRKLLLMSVVIPVLLHGTYDYILTMFKDSMLVIVPFMVFLWYFALKKVKLARAGHSIHR